VILYKYRSQGLGSWSNKWWPKQEFNEKAYIAYW